MKALYTFLIFLLIAQYKSETCNSQTIPEKITESCTKRDVDKDKDEYK